MILGRLITNQPTPAGLIGTRDADAAPLISEAALEFNTLRVQIEGLVQQIETPEVREIVGVVFRDLLRWLECLQLLEGHLRQVDAADDTFALFQFIHDEARLLVDFIRTDGLNCDVMPEEVADALHGITFVINHDLQRVFETDSPQPASEPTWHILVSKLYRAHDMLTNCMQQSTITLAMVLNPSLEGSKLFNNCDVRYRQSLQLCQELSELIQVVESSENAGDEASMPNLAIGIEKFRYQSMECLMYSDWPQFESFCERINLSNSDLPEQQSVIHQFRCYLETLLGQVRMRAVLASVFPVQFGDDSSYVKGPYGDNTARPASVERQGEDEAWNTLAIAV